MVVYNMDNKGKIFVHFGEFWRILAIFKGILMFFIHFIINYQKHISITISLKKTSNFHRPGDSNNLE
jgi:hypothetical protein